MIHVGEKADRLGCDTVSLDV